MRLLVTDAAAQPPRQATAWLIMTFGKNMNQTELNLERYSDIVGKVLASCKPSYQFFAVEAYSQLLTQGELATVNKIYTKEIIYRFHASALITLRRSSTWLRALTAAKQSNTYFSYCSSLRGLIESCADSFLSLKFVPQNLALYFDAFESCVKGKESSKVYSFKEFENWGLHFMEAGKYDDPSKDKEHFKAKMTWEYLKSLSTGNEKFKIGEIYERLCQVTHPSRDTTYLYFKQTGNSWSVLDVDEKEKILEMESLCSECLDDVTQKSLNTALIVLWIIEEFHIKELRCPEIRKINFDAIPEFLSIKKKMSRTRR